MQSSLSRALKENLLEKGKLSLMVLCVGYGAFVTTRHRID